jgi:hypothetical protein
VALHPGRASMLRSVVVTVNSEEEHGTYLVEWPKECRVTIKQIYDGMSLLSTINDICDCTACAYYQKCQPVKDRLRKIQTEVNE